VYTGKQTPKSRVTTWEAKKVLVLKKQGVRPVGGQHLLLRGRGLQQTGPRKGAVRKRASVSVTPRASGAESEGKGKKMKDLKADKCSRQNLRGRTEHRPNLYEHCPEKLPTPVERRGTFRHARRTHAVCRALKIRGPEIGNKGRGEKEGENVTELDTQEAQAGVLLHMEARRKSDMAVVWHLELNRRNRRLR